MKYLTVGVVISISLIFITSVNAQDLRIEGYQYTFPDTILEKSVTDSFSFEYKDKFEVKINSKIKGDSSFISFRVININPSNDMWLGTTKLVEQFDDENWSILILPDFNLNIPIVLCPIIYGQGVGYDFKEEGIFQTCDLAIYFLNDYREFIKNSTPKDYSLKFIESEDQPCIYVPHTSSPKIGISLISIERFPVAISESNMVFKILNY